MSHDLHYEHAVMGSRCRMNAIYAVRRYLNGTLKTKGLIGAVDVVINCLWQMDHVQAFLAQKIGCFLSSVTTQDHKAVQLKLLVVGLHGLNLI